MDNFDLKKYLAEGRLLSEIQYKEGDFNAISIGDKFIDTKKNIFTVVDVFSPGFTTEIEQVKLEDSNGNQSIWPDDFIDIDVEDGSFFDFFSTYKKDIAEGKLNEEQNSLILGYMPTYNGIPFSFYPRPEVFKNSDDVDNMILLMNNVKKKNMVGQTNILVYSGEDFLQNRINGLKDKKVKMLPQGKVNTADNREPVDTSDLSSFKIVPVTVNW